MLGSTPVVCRSLWPGLMAAVEGRAPVSGRIGYFNVPCSHLHPENKVRGLGFAGKQE